MELKTVALEYLWRAKQQNRNASPTSQNDYELLLSELRDTPEEQLLELNYSFVDKKTKQLVTRRVKDTLEDAIAQLTRYMDIISDGRGGTKARGVQDVRVVLDTSGDVLQDVLQGYVIICLGGKRVICRHPKTKATQHSYEVFPKARFEEAAFAPPPE